MKIFATAERQQILERAGIEFKIDQDLNLVFMSAEDERRAKRILKRCLAL